MPFPKDNESCTGCDARHVTVWLTDTFQRWCRACFTHHTGFDPEAEGAP